MNEAADGSGAPRALDQTRYSAQVRALADALREAHQVVAPIDLGRLGDLLERADAFGPLLHPSQWIAANHRGQLELQRALFRWAAETLRAFHECRRIHEGRKASLETGPRGRRAAR